MNLNRQLNPSYSLISINSMQHIAGKILFSSWLLLTHEMMLAQDYKTNIHNSSTIGAVARYEIVQSSLAAKWTFRLDRVCGTVAQLTSTQTETMNWEPMIIYNKSKCSNDGKNRYQLFTSGLAARHTFLMNSETGKTWLLTGFKDKDGNDFNGWTPFEEWETIVPAK